MGEHTPTPWKTSGRAVKQSNFGDYRCVVTHTANDGIRDFNETAAYALGGVRDLREVAEANAAFIVKAVNSHDALVKALEDLDAVLDFGDENLEPVWTFEDLTAAQAAFNIARQALAKAATS